MPTSTRNTLLYLGSLKGKNRPPLLARVPRLLTHSSSTHGSHCSECGALSPGVYDTSLKVAVAPRTLVRHRQLMTTNEPPPEDEDLTFIRAVVSKLGTRLADVENEISRLRDQLQKLEKERASLSRSLAQNNAVLSPLRRMPTELLGEIFSWTLPSVSEALNWPRFQAQHSPWVLTQVCRRWRAVALSTPSLWSRIAINFDFEHANPLSKIKAQIERANKLKIHFCGNKKPSRQQIEIFCHLAVHCSRWEELSIRLTPTILPLFASLRNHFPLLRRLIIAWEGPESPIGMESIDCFQTAPSLLDVHILSCYRHVSILFPTRHLTRYELGCPWQMHQHLLKLSVNLVQAHITVDFDNSDPHPDSHIIDLLHLQRLFVSRLAILDCLNVPALEELSLGLQRSEGPRIQTHLTSLLARSSSPLRRLCFAGALDHCADILHKTPRVVELGIIIDNPDSNNQLDAQISRFTITGSMPVAPQLRYMFFGVHARARIDYALYIKMLKSRWDVENSALKAATLSVESGPDPATLRALDALRLDGLDLLVLDGRGASGTICTWKFSAAGN
ncbi:hypothetical protein FB451DRAFT_1555457 [Mycena latifolia]|nr:hypothetical protein FB451DRAFT_1555457 [Mycena latifolia]